MPRHVVLPKWISPSCLWGRKGVSNINQSFFSSKSNHSSLQRPNVTPSLTSFFFYWQVAPVRLNLFCSTANSHHVPAILHNLSCLQSAPVCLEIQRLSMSQNRPFILSALALILRWQRNLLSRKKPTTMPRQQSGWGLVPVFNTYCKHLLHFLDVLSQIFSAIRDPPWSLFKSILNRSIDLFWGEAVGLSSYSFMVSGSILNSGYSMSLSECLSIF